MLIKALESQERKINATKSFLLTVFKTPHQYPLIASRGLSGFVVIMDVARTKAVDSDVESGEDIPAWTLDCTPMAEEKQSKIEISEQEQPVAKSSEDEKLRVRPSQFL